MAWSCLTVMSSSRSASHAFLKGTANGRNAETPTSTSGFGRGATPLTRLVGGATLTGPVTPAPPCRHVPSFGNYRSGLERRRDLPLPHLVRVDADGQVERPPDGDVRWAVVGAGAGVFLGAADLHRAVDR